MSQTTYKGLRIEDTDLEKIIKIGKEKKVCFSVVIRWAIAEYLDNHAKKTK